MEQLLAVQVQMLCNFVGMLEKPGGGERPIALTVALYCLYCNVRNVFAVQWDKDHAGFWDDAVRGSSALMAAIKRNISREARVALGISGAQILWDFEKFFDDMEVGILVMAALRYGYPFQCSHSVGWTRCFLYELFDTLHRDYIFLARFNS